MLSLVYNTLNAFWFIQEQSDGEDEARYTSIVIPMRINARWRKLVKHRRTTYQYGVTKALNSANISRDEFLKCWRFVRPRTPPDELFSWFKEARFGQGPMKVSQRTPLRMAFVRKILQRYKDISSRSPCFNKHTLRCPSMKHRNPRRFLNEVKHLVLTCANRSRSIP